MTFVWGELNHDNIFKAVEDVIKVGLSNILLKRNSYINRVYELEKFEPRERFITKFYRPGRWTPGMIQEEHNFLKELDEKDIPVIPPLTFDHKTLHQFGDIPFTIFPKRGGRPLDEFDEDMWKELGRQIARIHLVGELHDQANRIIWRPAEATKHHLDVLAKTDYMPPDFLKSFKRAAEFFIDKMDPMFEGGGSILLHGDMHKGNLIHRPGEGTFIIDFDDICLGPPVQDLWMLLPDVPEKCKNELKWFRDGYETFRDFDSDSLELIPALRGMRIIHFTSWLAVQCGDPDFDRHFPEARTKRYFNEVIKDLQSLVYDDAKD